MKGKCPYCDRQDEGNAGDYYHEKACKASHLRIEIKKEEAEEKPDQDKLKKLRYQLELALYVGD